MTAFSLSIRRPKGLGSWFDSSGQSAEAAKIHRALEVPVNPIPSVLLGSRFWALAEAYEEASEENWDGYGATPASWGAFKQAEIFLRLLPSTILDPDVAVDPDGDISFDWYFGPSVNFTVSINANGRLNYAGLYGESSVYGSEPISNELPRAVMDSLGRFCHPVSATRSG